MRHFDISFHVLLCRDTLSMMLITFITDYFRHFFHLITRIDASARATRQLMMLFRLMILSLLFAPMPIITYSDIIIDADADIIGMTFAAPFHGAAARCRRCAAALRKDVTLKITQRQQLRSQQHCEAALPMLIKASFADAMCAAAPPPPPSRCRCAARVLRRCADPRADAPAR